MHKIPYLPDTNRYKRKGKKQEFRDQITQVDSMEDINWIFFLVCLHFIQFKTQEVRFSLELCKFIQTHLLTLPKAS